MYCHQTKYNWTGLLVEPNSGAYQQLVGRRRRAHCVHSCLALTPHPDIVTFDSADVFGGINVKLDNVDNQHLENVNNRIDNIHRSIGSTTGFHNHGEGPY